MKEQKSVICSVCGAVLTEETKHEFDGKVMCESCLAGSTEVCERCGDRVWNEDAVTDSNVTLCNSCYDFYYTTCEDCGRIISNENTYYEDDESDIPYCHDCYQKLEEQYNCSFSMQKFNFSYDIITKNNKKRGK